MVRLWASPLAWAGILTLSSLVQGASVPRTKYNFNSDWKLSIGDQQGRQDPKTDDSSWKSVTLPYAWNGDEAFRLDIKSLSTGIAWYRKHFKVPASIPEHKFFLEFEGIRHGGEFYVNGKWVGRSDNGVMAFGFDVSEFLLPGVDNVVAARIDNSWDYKEVATGSGYQWSDKNFYANYGGINKNAFLHVTNKLHQTLPLYSNLNTTGTYIYATDIDIAGKAAKVTAETQVRNSFAQSNTFDYEVTIKDLKGITVKTFGGGNYTLAASETKTITASSVVNNLEFWSWGYGYLYDVTTTLSADGKVIDSVTTRTGFRKTEFTNGYFKLNDAILHLKGYAQRSTNEWPALGSAVPAWLSDFSNQLIVNSHGNLVRWMHVTAWKQDVESCDRVGLLQELPAGDSEADTTGRRWEQRLELMRDAIIYNRNNPSVVFLESGNTEVSEGHMSQMKAVRDKYDPHGGRAIGSREMLGSSVAEFGGEMLYVNKGKKIPFFAHEYSRDEAARIWWDDYSPPYHIEGTGSGEGAVYNRNQDKQAVENVLRWYDYWKERPGTGERVNAGGVNIIFSDSNTHHRGVNNYRRSGEVDAMRLKKDGWYAHQVMWNTWLDPDASGTFIVGHWNYNATTRKSVTVISSADRVELFLNGKSLGTGIQSSRFLFTFMNVAWTSGTLKAVGSGPGQGTSSDTRTTAGPPAALRLTKHLSPSGFRADGADIALIDVEVVDANGQRVPTALNLVDFKLSGEAEWRGGIAQGPNNYILATSLPVEGGINRIALRSTTKAGKISLSASSSGLSPATIEFSTVSFENTDGLSKSLPGSDLPPFLGRGPTPQGQVVSPKRKTLHITSATAGATANNGSPASAWDDNEETAWTSTSALSTAWITYQLAETGALINQVSVKTNNHRTASYPVQISVDGKAVWTGTLPADLGYITITFNETAGSKVRIASTRGALALKETEFYYALGDKYLSSAAVLDESIGVPLVQ